MRIAPFFPGLLLLVACSSGNSGFVYSEENGLTVIEAENWTQRGSADGLVWDRVTATGSDGSAVKLAGAGSARPGLSYDVTYTEAGTRYLWLRGRQGNPDSGVDIHLHSVGNSYEPNAALFSADWTWQLAATLTVEAEQMIRTTILARDTNVLLDKLLFTSNASFTPTGIGPDEQSTDDNVTVIVVGGDRLQVSGGSDHNLTLPDVLNLDATLDYRFSDGSVPTVEWSTRSGPADAIFSDPTSAATTAQFPIDGDYELRIEARANELVSTDDIAVTVLPIANLAPVAAISDIADNSIALNQTLQLTAEAQDDGLPDGVLYYWWSAISGPGEVFFGSQNQATTTVSFSSQGVYQIQLSVQDGVLNTLVEAQINVTEPADTGPVQGEDSEAATDLFLLTDAPLDSSSTYTAGSFRLVNGSATAQISSVAIDLASAAISDIVFDPLGTAGDSAFKDLSVDSGGFETGYASRQFTSENAGGYDQLELVFNDFQPGEEMTFSIDLDPANVQGVAPPGDRHAASISGFEIAGATVTVIYADGSSQSGRLFGTAGSNTAAQVQLRYQTPESPVLALLGVENRSDLDQDQQTVSLNGQPSQSIRLFVSEAGLYLEGTPDGGFDIDPYEPNTIINVQEFLVTLDSNGLAELNVLLPRSNADAGYYILQAAGVEADLVGSASEPVLVRR